MWSMPRLITAAERELDFLVRNIERGTLRISLSLADMGSSLCMPDRGRKRLLHVGRGCRPVHVTGRARSSSEHMSFLARLQRSRSSCLYRS